MNLALLDPFRRQIPDRIDSTLTVPRALHPLWSQNQSGAEGDQQSKLSTDGKNSPVNNDGEEVDTLQTSKSTDGEKECNDVMKEDNKIAQDEEPKKAKKRKKDTNKIVEENRYWTACYTVSFNQRGTALASAYASGLVPVHDFMSRTMSAVYWPPPPISLGESSTCASVGMENGFQFSGTFNEPGHIETKKKTKLNREQEGAATNKQSTYVNGVTSLSWDRHNRTVLAGSIGDYNLRLMDNSHPQVSLDCAEAVKREWMSKQSGNSSTKEEEKSEILQETTPSVYASFERMDGELVGLELQTSYWGRARLLRGNVVPLEKPANSITSSSAVLSSSPNPKCSSTTKVYCMRHPTLVLELPLPLAGPAQLHPQHISTGLACLEDGSLVLFYIPTIAFFETPPAPAENMRGVGETENLDNLKREDSRRVGNIGYLSGPSESKEDGSTYFITCATFAKNGEQVLAATKCGSLLMFKTPTSLIKRLQGKRSTTMSSDLLNFKKKPLVSIKVGAAAAWQIIVSRNGKYVLLNSADCALRLYDMEEISKHAEERDIVNIPPRLVFQDTLSKSPWASADFSADGEYIVGGCNSQPPGDNYNLFMWSTSSGELVDQLKGPQSSLYCLSCHPTRPFIAVGSSDGIIDIWGSLVEWTAFAPDFQARQANVLYEEKEDEFDIVVDGDESNTANKHEGPTEEEEVDIITSEKTADLTFPVRVLKLFNDKSKPRAEI